MPELVMELQQSMDTATTVMECTESVKTEARKVPVLEAQLEQQHETMQRLHDELAAAHRSSQDIVRERESEHTAAVAQLQEQLNTLKGKLAEAMIRSESTQVWTSTSI